MFLAARGAVSQPLLDLDRYDVKLKDRYHRIKIDQSKSAETQ